MRAIKMLVKEARFTLRTWWCVGRDSRFPESQRSAVYMVAWFLTHPGKILRWSVRQLAEKHGKGWWK